MGFDIENSNLNNTPIPPPPTSNTINQQQHQQAHPMNMVNSKDTLCRFKISRCKNWSGAFDKFSTSFINYPSQLLNYLPQQELSNLVCQVNERIKKEQTRRLIWAMIFFIGYLALSGILVFTTWTGSQSLIIALTVINVVYVATLTSILVFLDKSRVKKLDDELLDIESKYKHRGIIVSIKRKVKGYRRVLDFKATIYYPGYNSNLIAAPTMYAQPIQTQYQSPLSYIPTPYHNNNRQQETTPLLK